MSPATRTTRRRLLQGGAAGLALGQLGLPLHARAAEAPPLDAYSPVFFTAAEWSFVLAATARIVPSDGDGPGALETQVPVFIDRQLAGDFGAAADWYMEGPHQADAEPARGYQTPLTPAQVYRGAIPLVDQWCRSTHGDAFARLDPARQDEALTALDEGTSPPILPPELDPFFTLLLQNTKEGYFADPMYGGNAGMAAWAYIGFPGARAAYTEWVTRQNERYPLGPVSISGERA